MTKNRAAARHAKEIRRKALVAEKKRQDAVATSAAGRIAVAARLPIQHCLIMDTWERLGFGHIWVARGETPHEMTVALFLLNRVTGGVTDATLEEWSGTELAHARANLSVSGAMVDIPPADARKLLRDAARWFQSNGVPPHRDYAMLERIFGDVDADSSSITVTFGAAALAAWYKEESPTDMGGTVIEGEAVELTEERPEAPRD